MSQSEPTMLCIKPSNVLFVINMYTSQKNKKESEILSIGFINDNQKSHIISISVFIKI